MENYAKNKRLPSLQELADGLCEDDEMEYVLLTSQKMAKLNKIEVGQNKSIFTKLKKYPYEFEINGQLRLASIDGVKIEDNNSDYVSREEYNALRDEISQLREEIKKSPTNFDKFEKVVTVAKSSTNSGGIYYFTTDTDTTRDWNEEYFDYDPEQGFIAKKSGLFSVYMYGHNSATAQYHVKVSLLINNNEHVINTRFNSGSMIGPTSGWITVYIKIGDVVSGLFAAPSGINHRYNCMIYALQ